MTDQPAVSIIIPCYNAEEVLPRAVASVLAQSFKDWELILVDDCSTDGTARVAGTLQSTDPSGRIEVVHLAENSGSSAARNAGLDQATGTYVAFLDADDEMLPAFLARLVEAMAGDTDIVLCGHYMVAGDGGTTKRTSRQLGRLGTDDAVRAGMTGALTPFPWDKLYRRSLFDGLRYPVGAQRFEDMTMNVALYARSQAVLVLDEPLHRYYVSGGSLTWGRVPSAQDTEIALKHLESSLDPQYLTGRFASAYACMQTLTTMLVAQSAIAAGRSPEADETLRACRAKLGLSQLAGTAGVSPVLAAAGAVLKFAPAVFAGLYRRYAAKTYGMGKV
ncbi:MULTISPECIES: glycosyltransferase family 2 protein [unclassified Arthrobacter]|uniref:glycosyltransferase family 2 protein n=1 Tax=unclassified Arthrobacter TaxID=235627 RepID=UPI001E5E9BAC|nr:MULTISPECIES: glycosyltransferase family 2 protein [unclassified Arthrobacter]MCC9146469.1 glycosyltransferase [Arthrobacter sp. zg-Y919]MDK1277699.1 glycosyltransferase family 2 protein [Arthrobacter sp. zg.Y919]WIB02343.1 glycosyltransferase family 2 protein [Arthrobacter sp. zg-Y919]